MTIYKPVTVGKSLKNTERKSIEGVSGAGNVEICNKT